MKGRDGVGQRLALNEPHRVCRLAPLIGHQPIDRHNAGVLQLAGNLRLEQKPPTACGLVSVLRLNLLEGHRSAQLLVFGQMHDS
jgi:hypothetical protein